MPNINYKAVIGLFLVVVIGLYILPSLASATTNAQYGNVWTQNIGSVTTPTGNPAANYAWSLYGLVWNDTTQYTITVNGTTPTANSRFTVLGTTAPTNSTYTIILTAAHHFYATITYKTSLGAAAFAILPLVPLFDVIMILLCVILEVWLLVKGFHTSE
jgi:hypothetical protein